MALDSLKELPREEVLQLIISQLQQYDLTTAADAVAREADLSSGYAPSSQLAEYCYLGSLNSNAAEPELDDLEFGAFSDDEMVQDDKFAVLETEEKLTSLPAPNYTTFFTTTHKGAIHCSTYSSDGKFVTTGSRDSSLKVLEVSKMNATKLEGDSNAEERRPVVRTYYDHTAAVNEVAFHPNNLVVASCSDDATIRLFDLGKGGKRGFRFLQDSHPIKSISFHPSGDFVLSGTTSNVVRIHDIRALTCYMVPDAGHTKAITSVRYSPSANIFASASEDGSVSIFDTVGGKCINVIDKAHGGEIVDTVRFSKNGRYLLTAGRDNRGRLWDLTNGKTLVTYITIAPNIPKDLQAPATIGFSYNEDFVLMGEESNSEHSVVCFDARTGSYLRKFPAHADLIRCVSCSPVDPSFFTCAEDGRGKFWNIDI